ncbi:response regulator transcription factor [Blastococcus sp. MG754426]|uniref:response regulator transcription factor n=1 Tax=unclassified Blastococcus TaxID=2619396 RepID=UPI001EEFD6D9|nr:MULTISPECIES: response regulator transcription factor [unclassified Blastococcus]MCF6509221.1 response regulator transcription factor [Blastococcus sp. MG754426]MCF6513789.1 response regulator transcription factor [Blastococcus sp. MG754427]
MAAPPPTVRVFLVDDHEVVRRGVADVLEEDPAVSVVGEAGSCAEALARAPAVRPHVAVLDMRLPDGDGASLCRDLTARLPGLRCLVLTSYADRAARDEAVRAGAAGFVLKQVRGSALVQAVRTVAAGGTLPEIGPPPRPRSGGDRLAVLTDQERTVLALIGEGLTNRQIGERMGLAEKTVKNYTSHLLAKLGLERRTQAAILATELRDGRR